MLNRARKAAQGIFLNSFKASITPLTSTTNPVNEAAMAIWRHYHHGLYAWLNAFPITSLKYDYHWDYEMYVYRKKTDGAIKQGFKWLQFLLAANSASSSWAYKLERLTKQRWQQMLGAEEEEVKLSSNGTVGAAWCMALKWVMPLPGGQGHLP